MTEATQMVLRYRTELFNLIKEGADEREIIAVYRKYTLWLKIFDSSYDSNLDSLLQ